MGGSPAPKPLEAGDVIAAKFVVERTIGMGGMGQVVVARHQELGTRVAIKVVHPDRSTDAITMKRLKREALAMAKLQSEHAVRVYDVGELPDHRSYIIMEYLEGRDLGSVLYSDHPLPIGDPLRWIGQACEVLAEAHALGIIHRDLKPGNLFLTKRSSGEDCIRVLDFGLAKPMREASALTAGDQLVGTIGYMAPEQIRRGEPDARTDIWAAGVSLFRLLTREFPFEGGDDVVMCAQIMTAPPRAIRTLRPDVPPSVEAIIDRCLRKNPDERFPSIADLSTALTQALTDLPKAVITAELQSTMRMADAPSLPPVTHLGFSSTVPLGAEITPATVPMPAVVDHSGGAAAMPPVMPATQPSTAPLGGRKLALVIVLSVMGTLVGGFLVALALHATDRSPPLPPAPSSATPIASASSLPLPAPAPAPTPAPSIAPAATPAVPSATAPAAAHPRVPPKPKALSRPKSH